MIYVNILNKRNYIIYIFQVIINRRVTEQILITVSTISHLPKIKLKWKCEIYKNITQTRNGIMCRKRLKFHEAACILLFSNDIIMVERKPRKKLNFIGDFLGKHERKTLPGVIPGGCWSDHWTGTALTVTSKARGAWPPLPAAEKERQHRSRVFVIRNFVTNGVNSHR